MALSVISFATYLTRSDSPWGDKDFHALAFVKAIKGKSFNGWADVPVLGRSERLNAKNAADAAGWFAELAAAEIAKMGLPGPLILIPIPNSSSTVKNGKKPRTAALAEAIAAKLKNAKVWDGLRWTKEMTPTHQEGTREPQILYENLVVTSGPPKGTYIIVDDVFTKGGHMQAVMARLAEKKAKCEHAVCAGRTVLQPQAQPFSIHRHVVGEFIPERKK
jgi:hypothetical protein